MDLPSGVSSAREARKAASASSRSLTAATGRNSAACRLPSVIVPVLSSSRVSMSPAASTARPDLAMTLKRTSRSMPAMPMADSRPPIVVGIRVTSRASQIDHRQGDAGILREGFQRHDDDQEDDGQAGQQDVQRYFVRRLLPLGAFDQTDHAVEEAFARIDRDPHDDAVRHHPRSAGHRRPVAAALADDGSGLAGDGGFIDGGDAGDHVAVAGDHLARLDQDEVVGAQAGCRDLLLAGAVDGGHLAGGEFPSWICAGWRPAPCPGLPRWPRRSWRTAR